MVEDKEKLNSADDFAVVTHTAGRSLYLCVIFFALIATLATLLFPFSAMNFYEEMDNFPKAYQSARFAVMKSDGEDKVNAMIACVNYGAQLFEEKPDRYAKALYEDTTAFLDSDECVSRSKKIDEYNLANSNKALHPNLYSYLTYVKELKARCALRLGKTDEAQGYALSISGATSTLEKADYIYQTAAVYYESQRMGKKVDFIAEAELVVNAKAFLQDALSSMPDHQRPTLEGLYLVKAYEKLSARMTLNGSAVATEMTNVNYGSEEVSVHELYSTLLIRYCE